MLHSRLSILVQAETSQKQVINEPSLLVPSPEGSWEGPTGQHDAMLFWAVSHGPGRDWRQAAHCGPGTGRACALTLPWHQTRHLPHPAADCPKSATNLLPLSTR